MNKIRIFQIGLSVCAILATIPGAHAVAVAFDAYELIWLIPFLPAFTVTFFWIVLVMVGHFIQADSYKNPRAIAQARFFLKGFEMFFVFVALFFILAGGLLYQHFHA